MTIAKRLVLSQAVPLLALPVEACVTDATDETGGLARSVDVRGVAHGAFSGIDLT